MCAYMCAYMCACMSTKKRAEIAQSDEDYDEEEEEVQAEAAERDDELLDSLTGVLASLTKTHKEVMQAAFQPYVEVSEHLLSKRTHFCSKRKHSVVKPTRRLCKLPSSRMSR